MTNPSGAVTYDYCYMPSVTLSYFGIRCSPSVCLSVLGALSFSCAPLSVTNPSGAAPRPFLSFTTTQHDDTTTLTTTTISVIHCTTTMTTTTDF